MIGMKLADITLRLARRADVPTLATMSRDLIETGLGWHYRPERVAKFLDDPETATVVACDRERTVGFAIMQLFDERAHLVLLAVRPSHQQRGIGRRLTDWLVASASTARRRLGSRRAARRQSGGVRALSSDGIHRNTAPPGLLPRPRNRRSA